MNDPMHDDDPAPEVRTCASPAVGWDGYCTRTMGHDDEHRYESAYTLFHDKPIGRMMP